jgi:hypothetical protein
MYIRTASSPLRLERMKRRHNQQHTRAPEKGVLHAVGDDLLTTKEISLEVIPKLTLAIRSLKTSIPSSLFMSISITAMV